MMLYWSQEDDVLVVEVPEFSAEGAVDTVMYSEAIQYAEMTIEEWVKTAKKSGREVPFPKKGLTQFAQA